MARSVVVEVVVDSRQAERGFNRLSGSAHKAERDLNHTFRGVVSGSGVMRGLGRSLAFASTGFLAFATVSGSLRTSIDAATEAAATQRQLGAQFKASGLQLRDYRGAVEETSNRLSKLAGFTRDALEQSFLFAFRGTRNVSQALKIEAAAADVARGRHVGLQQATLAVTKGVTQNATALRRLGIAIPANIKGFQVLTYVQQRFAGQARAGTTAQERLGAALHNLAESAGIALLPTITRISTSLAAWASNTQNQRHVQEQLTKTLNSVKSAADAVTGAIKAADRITGSFTNTLKILLALGAGAKLAKIAAALGAFEALGGGSPTTPHPRQRFPVVPLLGAAGFAIAAGVLAQQAFGTKGGTLVGSGHDRGRVFAKNGQWFVTYVDAGSKNRPGRGRPGTFPITAPQATGIKGGVVGSTSGADTPGPHNVPAGLFDAPNKKSRNDEAARIKNLVVPFRLRLEAARAAVTATLKDDVKAAQDERKWLTALIASGRLREHALLEAYAELKGLNDTIAAAQATAAEKAAEAARKAAAKARQKAEEARRRLADARSAFTDAAASLKDTFKSAVDQVQGIIGDLFAGPVLAPTADQIKRRLGVRIAGSSIGGLTSDVQAQNAQARRFFADIARIRRRGGPQSLIDQLMQGGLADAPFAHTIAGAGRGDFRRLVGAVRSRDRLAAGVAMTTPEVKLAAKNVTIAAAKLTGAGGHPQTIILEIDGKVIARVVATEMQRQRRRGSQQRRGTG